MADTHPRITELIEDEFAGEPADAQNVYDRSWLAVAAQDAYVATVAKALEILNVEKLAPVVDDHCAEIGFLRGFHALSRAKRNKSWGKARTLSS